MAAGDIRVHKEQSDGSLKEHALAAADLTALGAVGSTTVTAIVALTQSAYDALPTKAPTTLYVITDP